MIWLTGARTPSLDKYACLSGNRIPFGLLITPFTKFATLRHNYEYLGIDNGCFSQPEKFNLETYLDMISQLWKIRGGGRPEDSKLEKHWQADTILFATAPDVVGDWYRTLIKSLPILPKIREAGAPAALCAQEGIENVPLDSIPWDSFDVLFVGGEPKNDDWFKLGPAIKPIIKEAHRRNKWVHAGRINGSESLLTGMKRIMQAYDLGYDSSDGTYVRYRHSEPFKGTDEIAHWMQCIMRRQLPEWELPEWGKKKEAVAA